MHTIIAASTSVPITFSTNGQSQYQVSGCPSSVRFVNQHIESNDALNSATTAYAGLTSIDFGIKSFQHIADGNVLQDYPIKVQGSCDSYDMASDCAYLKKRALKEYTKLNNTCVTPSIYSGFGSQGVSAPAIYPTCNLSGANVSQARQQFNRWFRLSANLGSANEDVYSGQKIATSFVTSLFFGPDALRSQIFTTTSTATQNAGTPITSANLVHLFYANAEVTLGLTSAQLNSG
jgi:hypothetical protein